MTKTLDKLQHYNISDKYYADTTGIVYFNRETGKGGSKRYKGDIVKSFINRYGYVEYILDDGKGVKKHIQAHRIVASLFINQINTEQVCVNHKDGNKLNNALDNLEWCTHSENEQHSYSVLGKIPWNKGLKGLHQNKPNPVERYSLEGSFEKEYISPKATEKEGYCLKQVSAVCNGTQKTHKGKIWKFKQHTA